VPDEGLSAALLFWGFASFAAGTIDIASAAAKIEMYFLFLHSLIVSTRFFLLGYAK
jgi:hypothetical protein